MKSVLIIWFSVLNVTLNAQTESKSNKILFKGYTFGQTNYSESNCVFAKTRKDTMKEFINSYDTVCSHVEFFDLTVSGPNSVVADAINSKMKSMSLIYGEESYNSPQLFCSGIADSYAKDGFIELEVGLYFKDSFKTFCNLEYSIGEYAGGAHRNYYFRNLIFDTKDGTEVQVESILNDSNLSALRKLLYKKFIKSYNLGALLIDVNKPEEFPLPEFISINSDGIRFTYNTYEIMPYCYGMPEFNFSFREIYPYLTPWFKQFVAAPPKAAVKKTKQKVNSSKRR